MVAHKPQVNIDIVIHFTILSPQNTFCAPNFDRKVQPEFELMKGRFHDRFPTDTLREINREIVLSSFRKFRGIANLKIYG
jgi:hypothetical protein